MQGPVGGATNFLTWFKTKPAFGGKGKERSQSPPARTQAGLRYCYKFLKNECTKGDACPFAHIPGELVDQVLQQRKEFLERQQAKGRGKKGGAVADAGAVNVLP